MSVANTARGPARLFSLLFSFFKLEASERESEPAELRHTVQIGYLSPCPPLAGWLAGDRTVIVTWPYGLSARLPTTAAIVAIDGRLFSPSLPRVTLRRSIGNDSKQKLSFHFLLLSYCRPK